MRAWRAEALVLRVRRHGESAAIVDALTEEYGRIVGHVRGGASRKNTPMLQPGNRVHLDYHARLEQHLGQMRVEPVALRTGQILQSRDRLCALQAMTALLVFALPEYDPHPRLARATELVISRLKEGDEWRNAYLRWELLLLEELGFGLDLSKCAVRGTDDRLAFVSPRTGRAVSLEGAGNWAARLLALPPALLNGGEPGPGEMQDGLRMTGYFLENWMVSALGDEPLPAARQRLTEVFAQDGIVA